MSQERCTPTQMRQSLELAHSLKNAGIRFVPIPVMNEDEHRLYMKLLHARLENIECGIKEEK